MLPTLLSFKTPIFNNILMRIASRNQLDLRLEVVEASMIFSRVTLLYFELDASINRCWTIFSLLILMVMVFISRINLDYLTGSLLILISRSYRVIY